MFTRVLTRIALGLSMLLGAIAVIAVPGMTVVGAVFGVIVGAFSLMWVRDASSDDAATTARAARRAGLLVGAGVAGAWLAVTGLVVLLGAASGPALLLVVVATLAAWLWRRPRSAVAALRSNPLRAARDHVQRAAQRPDVPRRIPTAPKPVPTTTPLPAPSPSGPDPASLSTQQLCLAWQRTYFALLDLPAGPPHSEVVALRGRLLDEIERRDPPGFTRWLGTDARASSNPGRYLTGDR